MAKKGPRLQVRVSTPTEVLWEGEADSVSGENSQGKFDILPLHANFITLVQDTPIIIRMEAREKQFSFKNAVIHTDESVVKVYGDV